jgi:hypothetical protein
LSVAALFGFSEGDITINVPPPSTLLLPFFGSVQLSRRSIKPS